MFNTYPMSFRSYKKIMYVGNKILLKNKVFIHKNNILCKNKQTQHISYNDCNIDCNIDYNIDYNINNLSKKPQEIKKTSTIFIPDI